MTAFIPSLLVKLTLILSAGLLVGVALKNAPASLRHLVMLATLVCGLTLPLAMVISPDWRVALLPQSAADVAGVSPRTSPVRDVTPRQSENPLAADAITIAPAGVQTSQTTGRQAPRLTSFDAESLAFAVPAAWLLGVLSVVGWLALGRLRLRRIRRGAWELRSADWRDVLGESKAEAGVTREVLLATSSYVTTPLTWGWFAPVVLLPDDAIDWAEDHRRVVLRHELAHVSRRDSFTQLVAGVVCALYWFHPLVWITERRLRAYCERACDDRVLALGTPAPEYAAHLLEVARSARSFGAPGFLSVAMARPTQLEGRLLAVLNNAHRRIGVSPTARWLTVLLAFAVLFPLAAFKPVQREPMASASRALVDPPAVKPAATSATLPGPASLLPDVSAAAAAIEAAVTAKSKHAPDTTFALSAPARSGGTLELELKTGGGLDITSWDKPEVAVLAALSGRDWRATRVSLEPANGRVRLISDFDRYTNNQSTSHHFTIQVPQKYNIRVRSAGGGITITNLEGRFYGNTGGGEIIIRNAKGEANLSTGGGEISVSDSRLDGKVSTGGGRVRITGVDGDLAGYSGSGPVMYTNASGGKYSQVTAADGSSSISVGDSGVSTSRYMPGSGRNSMTTTTDDDGRVVTTARNDGRKGKPRIGAGGVRWTTAGGALKLEEAPNGASLETGGGSITIGPSNGQIYAQTGGGSIEIGPATGSVEATTGSGAVKIELKGPDSHEVDVTTGNGAVTIIAPADLNATLELESAYTDNARERTQILSDWKLPITETSDWDDSEGTPRKYVRARQVVGKGGPVIRVRAVNGNVLLKKAR